MTRLRTPLLQDSVLDEQIKLETRAVDDGIARYKRLAEEATRRGAGAQLKPAERLIVYWMPDLTRAMRRLQRSHAKGMPGPSRHLHAHLVGLVHPQRMAYVLIHTMLSMLMLKPTGVKRTHLAAIIGRNIIAEVNADTLREEKSEEWDEFERTHKKMHPDDVNALARAESVALSASNKEVVSFGLELLWIVVDQCAIPVKRGDELVYPAAFKGVTRRFGKKTPTFIVPTNHLLKVIDDGHEIRKMMRPRYLPMLVQPYRWNKDQPGGYVRIRTPLISKIKPHQREAINHANMDRVYDGLHAVSSTAWHINRRILELIGEVWATGGNDLSVPRADDMPLPPPPSGFDEKAPRGKRWKNVAPEAREQWVKEYARKRKQNILARSERETFIRKFDIATMMQEHEAFYLPHQMDFRSRCYPIPQPLHHHNDDLCRGLLQFAVPKDMGEHGREWVYIHAANSYGLDKIPFANRIEWVRQSEAEIKKCAADPMAREFWRNAKQPWQFLAACMAIAGDPRRIPIQLDGTANVLQHYAAMTRDPDLAAAVNMIDCEEPADPYRNGAAAMQTLVTADIIANMIFQRRIRVKGKKTLLKFNPQLVDGLIDRDMAKPPWMTTFYGSTLSGIIRQIKTRLLKVGKHIEPASLFIGALYLAEVAQRSIRSSCPSAHNAKAFLTACGEALAEHGVAPAWLTKIGFPVVQGYRKPKRKQIHTLWGNVQLAERTMLDPIRRGKHKTSIAPNFVHSLDATHMLMTASAAVSANLDFAAVHDSYWTHAGSVRTLGQIIRTQFIDLHSGDALADFADQCRRLCPEATIPDPPARGSFDMNEVMRARYFFC